MPSRVEQRIDGMAREPAKRRGSLTRAGTRQQRAGHDKLTAWRLGTEYDHRAIG